MTQPFEPNKPGLLNRDAIENDLKQNNEPLNHNYNLNNDEEENDQLSHNLTEAKNLIYFNDFIENNFKTKDDKINQLTNNLNSLKNFIQLTKQTFFNK